MTKCHKRILRKIPVQGLLRQGGQESQSPGLGSGAENPQGGGPDQGGAATIVCCMVDTGGPAAGGGGAAGYPVAPLVTVSEEGVSSHLKYLYRCTRRIMRGDPYLTNGRSAIWRGALGPGRKIRGGHGKDTSLDRTQEERLYLGRFPWERRQTVPRTKEQSDPFYPDFSASVGNSVGNKKLRVSPFRLTP